MESVECLLALACKAQVFIQQGVVHIDGGSSVVPLPLNFEEVAIAATILFDTRLLIRSESEIAYKRFSDFLEFAAGGPLIFSITQDLRVCDVSGDFALTGARFIVVKNDAEALVSLRRYLGEPVCDELIAAKYLVRVGDILARSGLNELLRELKEEFDE